MLSAKKKLTFNYSWVILTVAASCKQAAKPLSITVDDTVYRFIMFSAHPLPPTRKEELDSAANAQL